MACFRLMKRMRWCLDRGLLFRFPLNPRGLTRDEIRRQRQLWKRIHQWEDRSVHLDTLTLTRDMYGASVSLSFFLDLQARDHAGELLGGERNRTPVGLIEALQGLHIVAGQREVKYVEVLAHPLDLRGLGDCHDALLN